jgi:hypothetical protein
MIKYVCTSSIDKIEKMSWEDFFPVKKESEDNHPKITVHSPHGDGCKWHTKTDQIEFSRDPQDGWYDGYVPVFDLESIKAVIAKINKTDPSNIEIEWRATVQAC